MSRKKIYPIEDLSEDTKKLFDVLNEGNDLSCVLIGTSFLDETLRTLLQKYFIKSNTAKNLLNPQGALGTFGSRCDLAYSLTLINKKKYNDLKVIEEIRNLFAHSHLTKSFRDSEVITFTDKLTYCDILKGTGIFQEIENPSPEQIYTSSRSRFHLTIVLLSQELLVSGLSIKHKEMKK